MNLIVHLNAYNDKNSSNSPSLNLFKWNRDLQGLDISEPESKSISLPAGQSLTLFSGSIPTSANNTTTWNIALKAGTSNTYKISKNSGTSPAFRTQRILSLNNTSQISVTKNASLLVLSVIAGPMVNFASEGVIVGDGIRLGSAFNSANQGKFKVLATDSGTITIENSVGVSEASVALGAGFATQFDVFSSSGVQVGDQADIIAGFSSVSFGTYDITDVSPDYIEIYSLNARPTESSVSNSPSALSIYRSAKKFVYIESNKKLEITIDGSATSNKLEPMNAGTSVRPGVFMSSSSMKSLEIINKSQDAADIFYVTAE